MLDSHGSRLLLWHTAIVATVIAVFGGTVCYLMWRASLADVDRTLAARAGVLAAALQPADRDTFNLTLEPAAAGQIQLYHALWTRDGTLIDLSDDNLTVPFPAVIGVRSRDGRREFSVRTPSGAVVLAGRDLGDMRAALWSLAVRLVSAGGAVLALAFGGGWLLARRALAPINRINHTARQMIDGDLSARIPVERVATELGQVARALNEAFDRLQASLDRQRRLSADVSHELRTPLATMSTEVQWALERDRDGNAYRESLAVCRRAMGRMQAIVERLLSLARAETPTAHDVAVPLSLEDVVRQAVEQLSPLALDRKLTMTADLQPATVMGDADRLFEAIVNVVANAISYNVPEGRVAVTLEHHRDRVELAVEDTGVGIAAKDLPLVFDPFFRADQARSRDAGGAGLGLAVTRAIIQRHGGTIACTSEPGKGTRMVIQLPAVR